MLIKLGLGTQGCGTSAVGLLGAWLYLLPQTEVRRYSQVVLAWTLAHECKLIWVHCEHGAVT